jgi:hypothetical protein
MCAYCDDREWAEFMKRNRRDYPLFGDTPVESVVRSVRAQRLEAERERRAFRYPEVPAPPNYALFR